MKQKIMAFIDSLIKYDYILFGSILAIFFVLILISLLYRKKIGVAVSIIIFAFVFLIVAPIVGYVQMHKYLFKHELTLTSQKKLQYTKAVVVFGKLKNTSNMDFQSCKITAGVNKITPSEFKNYIYSFKPIMKMSIVEEDIVIGNEIEFKMIIEPFTYPNDYDISLKAKCR